MSNFSALKERVQYLSSIIRPGVSEDLMLLRALAEELEAFDEDGNVRFDAQSQTLVHYSSRR